jgi:hypothetical protein
VAEVKALSLPQKAVHNPDRARAVAEVKATRRAFVVISSLPHGFFLWVLW